VAAPTGPVPDPTTIRQAARDILRRPEFRTAPQPPLTRLQHWISSQLQHLIDSVLSGNGLGLAGLAFTVVIVAALAVIAVRVVRSSSIDRAVGYALDGPRRPATDWRAEAAAAEAVGDWRNALRCRYRALVADLAARGVIEEVAGRTTGEYRSAVDLAQPGAAMDFGVATDLFEAAWYGDQRSTAADVDALKERTARLLGEVRV